MTRASAIFPLVASLALAACDSVDVPARRQIDGQANVAIIIMDGLFITEASAPFDVYKHAGDDMNVYFVAESMDPITTYEGAQIHPDYTFADAPRADILVVPSGGTSMDEDLEDHAYIDYVARASGEAVYVTSHCWGAFALAKAGVLDGRRATTFPGYFDELRTAFPSIGEVVENQRWVEDEHIITSNGGLAAFEASLHVVELVLGQERADEIAAALVYAPENVDYSRDPLVVSVPGTDEERPEVTEVKNVAILIIDQLFITEATAPFDIYKHAGDKMNVYFISEDGEAITSYENARIEADYSFADAPQADVLVVPSGNDSMEADLDNQALLDFVAAQAAGAEWVTSHCWGAFTLAGAGLLDGRTATTFPGYFDELDTAFPDIGEVVTDTRVVRDGNIVTSNGGLAAYEASLYVIEEYFGAVEAEAIAAGLVLADENLANARSPHIVE